MERTSLQADGSSPIQDIYPFHDADCSITFSLNVLMAAAILCHKCLVHRFRPRSCNIHFDIFLLCLGRRKCLSIEIFSVLFIWQSFLL